MLLSEMAAITETYAPRVGAVRGCGGGGCGGWRSGLKVFAPMVGHRWVRRPAGGPFRCHRLGPEWLAQRAHGLEDRGVPFGFHQWCQPRDDRIPVEPAAAAPGDAGHVSPVLQPIGEGLEHKQIVGGTD